MPTQPDATAVATDSGVFVPHAVIVQLDEALAALYGLIEAAIAMIEEDVPEGIEASVITYGLVSHFFMFYHILNDAKLLFATSFDTGETSRPWRFSKR